ncbi:IS21 family transposase [Ferrimicrobium sp.]|uniref:IS21 family transposase n=1 Tax=Ferrimicrobium sp. TaxID=2926050 RepID=UPI002604AFAE|nr:IS21 family transposase [Ferrimicrobium sp.]
MQPDQIRRVISYIDRHPDSSARSIENATGVSHQSVTRLCNKLADATITEEILSKDSTLLELLYPTRAGRKTTKVAPDYEALVKELRDTPHLTRELLWEEYCQINGENSYSYSEFCRKLARVMDQGELTMLLVHGKGSALMVDYAGDTVPIWDRNTGEIAFYAQVFVATLSYSGYTFGGVYESQRIDDFLSAIMDALEFFGGLPAKIIPDNLRSAVTKHTRDELIYNATFGEFCTHYGIEPAATRPYRPKDKAKAEGAVYRVETRILARLRHERFFSVAEANEAVRGMLADLNGAPFKHLAGSRDTRFVEEQPYSRPLPVSRYELAEFLTLPVGPDYHFMVHTNRYSVPVRFRNTKVRVKVGKQTIEVFSDGESIAIHDRVDGENQIITNPAHPPPEHQGYLEAEELLYRQARAIGESTESVIRAVVASTPFRSVAQASAKALLRLLRAYPEAEAELACHRALMIGSPTRESVESILTKGLAEVGLGVEPEMSYEPHANLRGPGAFRIGGIDE